MTTTSVNPKQSEIVITGIGVNAPGGKNKEEFWHRICSGVSAVRKITSFNAESHRTQIAAECDTSGNSKSVYDRCIELAESAFIEALEDADCCDGESLNCAIVVGNAVGATVSMEQIYCQLSENGKFWDVKSPSSPQDAWNSFVPSSLSSYFAKKLNITGPAFNVSNGCTSGIDALTYSKYLITSGIVDKVIAVSVDAPISPITLACFDAIRATNPQTTNVENASRPFDKTRSGLVLGEGAAVMVIEKESDALIRGVKPYAAIKGTSNRMNAYHMTGLKADAAEMTLAIEQALEKSGLKPEAIDYVNAHGSSTKQNDIHETNAFKNTLGQHAFEVPVSSIKGVVGHSLGAIGMIELAACALALTHQMVPPTANLHCNDEDLGLDFVPLTPRNVKLTNILKVGSGFGGFQSAVVLSLPSTGVRK